MIESNCRVYVGLGGSFVVSKLLLNYEFVSSLYMINSSVYVINTYTNISDYYSEDLPQLDIMFMYLEGTLNS